MKYTDTPRRSPDHPAQELLVADPAVPVRVDLLQRRVYVDYVYVVAPFRSLS